MVEKVLLSYLEHICGKVNVRENVPLSNLTTFNIGGPARFVVTVQTKDALVRLVSALIYIEYPFKIIGSGSNILASDDGFDGVVVKLGFREIVENGNFIYADAGASLVSVSKRACELGFSGVEFACGIPGTIGGAVIGNVGAFGSCMKDIVVMVDVLEIETGEIRSLDNIECGFDYRESLFKSSTKYIILGAYLGLLKDDKNNIQFRMDMNNQKRIESQPKGSCAGSIFRNPTGYSAGAIIDGLGLKGTRVGGAVISDKHANFIMNDGNATAKDVTDLINMIQERAQKEKGLDLLLEIEIMK